MTITPPVPYDPRAGVEMTEPPSGAPPDSTDLFQLTVGLPPDTPIIS